MSNRFMCIYIYYSILNDIFCLCPVAGVFCAIVSHPADSVVSVLNKEKGSTAGQVLKRLGPMGEFIYWFIYLHSFASSSTRSLDPSLGSVSALLLLLSVWEHQGRPQLPPALLLYRQRRLSHWRVRSVHLLTQNSLCPEPSQEYSRTELLGSGHTV